MSFLVEHNLSVCRTNDLRCMFSVLRGPMLNEVFAEGGVRVGLGRLRTEGVSEATEILANGGDCRECNLNICICFQNGNSWHV